MFVYTPLLYSINNNYNRVATGDPQLHDGVWNDEFNNLKCTETQRNEHRNQEKIKFKSQQWKEETKELKYCVDVDQ